MLDQRSLKLKNSFISKYINLKISPHVGNLACYNICYFQKGVWWRLITRRQELTAMFLSLWSTIYIFMRSCEIFYALQQDNWVISLTAANYINDFLKYKKTNELQVLLLEKFEVRTFKYEYNSTPFAVIKRTGNAEYQGRLMGVAYHTCY